MLFEWLSNQVYLLLLDFLTHKDISERKKLSYVKYAQAITIFEVLAGRLIYLLLQV